MHWPHYKWRKLMLPSGLCRGRRPQPSGQGCNKFSVSKNLAQLHAPKGFTALRGKATVSATHDRSRFDRYPLRSIAPRKIGPAQRRGALAITAARGQQSALAAWTMFFEE